MNGAPTGLPALWLAVPWALPWAMLPRLASKDPDLASVPPAMGPLVSVVVPARNEAANIATVLETLRRSTYQPLEIVVVDDRSSDETGLIAGRIAAADDRIRVITGEEVPPGWFGKPWACQQGYRAARGDLLLFTDADTRHHPDALTHAVGALDREQADLVTVITGLDLVTFWERVAMPQFWVPLGFRYPPRRINQARHTRDLIANGQFILVRRASYERAGTHEAVMGDVAEDLRLAHVFHRAGLRLYAAHAERLVRTRMYTGLRQLVEGWSKNLYVGGRASLPDEPVLRALLPWGIMVYALYWLVPILWLVIAPGPIPFAAFGLAAGFWAMVGRGMGIPSWYGVLHPLGAAVLLFVALRSTWRGGRRIEWRGRTYALNE